VAIRAQSCVRCACLAIWRNEKLTVNCNIPPLAFGAVAPSRSEALLALALAFYLCHPGPWPAALQLSVPARQREMLASEVVTPPGCSLRALVALVLVP
jgi:hypothetical protein